MLQDYQFQFTIDGGPTHTHPSDIFPLGELDELEEMCELMIEEWGLGVADILMSGVAPALTMAISGTQSMVGRLGTRSDDDTMSEVRFTVINPKGDLLYKASPVQLGCVEVDGRGHVVLRPKDFSNNLADLMQGEPTLEEIQAATSKFFPTADEMNETLIGLSNKDRESLMMLTLATIKGLAKVVSNHSKER